MIARLFTIGISIAATACTLPYRPYSFSGAEPIPAAWVINGIKCEIRDFLEKEPKLPHRNKVFKLDPKKYADMELSLKTIRETSNKGGVSAVIPFQGGTFVPTFTLYSGQSHTIDSTLNMVLTQRADLPIDCPSRTAASASQEDAPAGIGLSDWLLALFREETEILSGAPQVGLDTIVISSEFGIKKEAGGSGALQFVPLNLSVAVSQNRSDTHELKLTFRTALAKSKDGTIKPGDEVLREIVPTLPQTSVAPQGRTFVPRMVVPTPQ